MVNGGILSREWVKCVTRTRIRVGKSALGFYESLKMYSNKTNVVNIEMIRYKA